MAWYLLKLAVVLPLILAAVWASLKLARRLQDGIGGTAGRERGVRIVETLAISPTQRIAVIAFHDREILVSASKAGVALLAEAPARAASTEGETP